MAPTPSPAPPPARQASRRTVVTALGVTQTLAWASSYYLPAIFAAPMAAEFGLRASTVLAAFSAALLLTALLGPSVGRLVDRHGGRGVLAGSNLVLALGLGLMAVAPNPAVLFLGWGVLGLGMALGLYDTAFAALAGLYGREARGAITGVTLFAGFASTVGWPLSTLMAGEFGWRGALLAWAGAHLLAGLPLNLLCVPRPSAPAAPAASAAAGEAELPARRGAMALLALALAASGFNIAAFAAHLPGVLALAGASAEAALLAASLVGPMQVAARVLEFSLLRGLHPLWGARLATAAHPLAGLALLAGGPAMLLAVLHGAGNGILTIVRGTLPLALFGARGYGARQGWILAPMRLLQALAPVAFGLALERMGLAAIWVYVGTGLVGLAALAALRAR